MMRFGSLPTLLGPLALLGIASPALGQGRIVDEGTFSVSRRGSPPSSESFKISRDNGLIMATGQVIDGSQLITSSLIADTAGTPVRYELHVKDKGAQVFKVSAVARAGRLTSLSSTKGGDESMREYPLSAGQSFILETGLLHHLYFAALGKRSSFQVIEPRASRVTVSTLTPKGLEPVDVAGRSVTGTHYSLTNGPVRYEFWVDGQGRLLRVEVPDQGLTATREELPR